MRLLVATVAIALVFPWAAQAQVPTEELAPLLYGIAHVPEELERRVPLMTDDEVVAPLYSVQVHSPTNVPIAGSSCTVKLLEHSFGEGSYNTPAVVSYAPPTDSKCGQPGQWAAITMNLTSYAIGTQYDRLAEIYLGHVEIWRSSSAEPTKTGTVWSTVKDVTHYAPLFASVNDLMMDFSNIIAPDLLLDAPFEVTISVTFYAPTPLFPSAKTADLIIPLSNMSPDTPNMFILDSDTGATTNINLPANAEEALVEVYCSGNSAEEFWYANTPDEFVDMFPGTVTGKGPFREVQVIVDGLLAGVVWPMPVVYTGGVTPSNWRPLTSYGAYDQPHYLVDITPFLPVLLANSSTSHNVTLRVQGQGLEAPSFNSNWYISGSVHVRLGSGTTTGTMTKYDVGELHIDTTGGASDGNGTVWTKVTASRKISVESTLKIGNTTRKAVFSQNLSYSNDAKYEDEGWLQWVTQSTIGTTESTVNGIVKLRDAFEYPFYMYSNYSTYTQQYGGYGSTIKQSHKRSLATPYEPYVLTTSSQQAEGWINMDDWPGLRHAINGTGKTSMTFAYADARLGTYYRAIAAKNDGWVRDTVWGTLASRLPALPKWQISGPDGGNGFKRSLGEPAPRHLQTKRQA
ncbi:peptide N-acetyl-beta-D-glucosaminyl asparaginase amidase A-domain-containing protein [Auriculariales sp. MPI-PUGE-AT-0066]|nr:peptide N-acetyl-beta-D-glucosaminyl asparaginase amidase A-domain-containing protein [Auriculariales sp. MPI-PUGE-AT-0066]